MDQYLKALSHVIEHGDDKTDRTGTGTRSVFGYQMRFNLQDGFPAVTTKKLAWKSVVSELLWMLEGSTDERRLAEIHFQDSRENLIGKRTIWTANADDQAAKLGYTNTDTVKDLGPVYGGQWRQWDAKLGHVDQIAKILDSLYYNPDSRRHIVSAWNADQVDVMALPPCHCLFQFYVSNNKLSCQLYQRSADLPLGVPFNIASYSLLTHIIAKIMRLEVGDFIHTFGDMHIYSDQIETAKEQLTRTPYSLPKLELPEFESIEDVITKTVPNDYKLIDYVHHPKLDYNFST